MNEDQEGCRLGLKAAPDESRKMDGHVASKNEQAVIEPMVSEAVPFWVLSSPTYNSIMSAV